MNKFDPRLDILPPSQIKLWPQLRPSIEGGFVLYGGTALALRLGHRESIDFDFFSEKPLDKNNLYKIFSFLDKSTIIQNEKDTLVVLVPDAQNPSESVKVSFFGNIGIGRISTPDLTNDEIMLVASLEDIMATKLKVLFDRVEKKDYQDIAAMIKCGVSLENGLAAAMALFGPQFQPMECLRALCYFEGGDLDCLSVKDKKVLQNAVKNISKIPELSRKSDCLGLDFNLQNKIAKP